MRGEGHERLSPNAVAIRMRRKPSQTLDGTAGVEGGGVVHFAPWPSASTLGFLTQSLSLLSKGRTSSAPARDAECLFPPNKPILKTDSVSKDRCWSINMVTPRQLYWNKVNFMCT